MHYNIENENYFRQRNYMFYIFLEFKNLNKKVLLLFLEKEKEYDIDSNDI